MYGKGTFFVLIALSFCSAVGMATQKRDIFSDAGYDRLKTTLEGVRFFAEQHDVQIRLCESADGTRRDFVGEGSVFGARPLRYRFMRLEKGVPVYDAGTPCKSVEDLKPLAADGSSFDCASATRKNLADLDGDGVDDLVMIDVSQLGADTHYPWKVNPWDEIENPVAGIARGYDVFGRWLGADSVSGVRWAKGLKQSDGSVRFGTVRDLLVEKTSSPGVRAAFRWKSRSKYGMYSLCTVRTKAGRWAVITGDVDKLYALPLSVVGADVFCGKPVPLLKHGAVMPHNYWIRNLVPVDADMDGKTEIYADGNPGVVTMFKGNEPGDFVSVPLQIQGGDVCMETLSSPYRVDWDRDGLPDLIMSDASGWIMFWKGTKDPMSYQPGRKFVVDGKPLRIQAGSNGSLQGYEERAWGYVKVIAGRWGDRMVLVTCDIRGEFLLHECVSGEEAGVLALKPAVPFTRPDGSPYLLPWRSRPDFIRTSSGFAGVPHDSFVLLDLDGDVAVAVPTKAGGTIIGSTEKLRYADGRAMRLCGKNGLWGRGHLSLADWDGDGNFDLVFGTNFSCNRFFTESPGDWRNWFATPYLFRNVGSNSKPSFAYAAEFADGKTGAKLCFGWHNATPCVTDLNGDAKPDLLIGAENGKVYSFLHETVKTLEPRGPASLPEVELETGNPYGLVRAEKTEERPVVRLRNPTLYAMRFTGTLRFDDGFGRTFSVAVPPSLGPGAVRELPLPWPLPAKGCWTGLLRLVSHDGKTVERTLRFAYIDYHGPTPFAARPKFRFGLNIGYSAEDLEAVVAAGFKLVRTTAGTTMGEAQGAGEGRFDWSGADRAIGAINGAGIALDAILYSTPYWAIDEKLLSERQGVPGVPWLMPTRPDLFREHCRRVAERFGKKIDYYEVGNEFDIRDPRIRTHEEATRMQREAYEGVHAVCPGAWVIPGGFAGAAPLRQYPNAAAVMENYVAHPEYYDAWAFHCHGAFHDYVRILETLFLPFRASTALKEKPWIPNETALSCYKRSETDVARTAWAKPLYAWSRGAADYIWYNLVAIGPQDDNETGYGILTYDKKPRAAYAAFSALTRIFQGLDYDGAIYSRKLRHLLRFRGKSEGADGLVVAGWDWQAKVKRTVRIRTDARQAWVSDCMGNLSEVKLQQGEVCFVIGSDPKAVILSGATKAEAADLAELEDAPAEARAIPPPAKGRVPDFRLEDARHVREFHPSAVSTAHRVWSGPQDQSASVWLELDGENLKVYAEVQDDVDASGDGMVVQLDLAGRGLAEFGPKSGDGCAVRKWRKGSVTSWLMTIDCSKNGMTVGDLVEGIGFGVRFLEDDGEGLDGWLQLTTEIEDLRRIRFVR